jgi:uncharacterized protein
MHRLIVMTKYPEAGRTKTRLIPALGVGGAADLHARLALHCIQQIQSDNLEVRYSGGNLELMRDWLGDLNYVPQGEGDLGDRMRYAFDTGFIQGCTKIVMIGTDCPAIDQSLIRQTFKLLDQIDVVLGPALDGGYYLIGLRQMIPELFVRIPWSTDTVLRDSLTIATTLNLSYQLLQPLPDIDRPEDLQYLTPYPNLSIRSKAP